MSMGSMAARWFGALGRLPHTLGRPVGRVAYVPQVDGIRFLAVFLVFLWHGSLRAERYVGRLHTHGYHTGSLMGLFLHGEVGVDLFFFISGLVIAQSFLFKTDLSRTKAWSFRAFYAKRFIRIYPPYLISLLVCYLVLAISGYHPRDVAAFGSNISLTSSLLASAVYLHSFVFDASSRLNPPMWSLEIEIQFYLLVPFFMLLYLRLRQQAARMAMLALVSASLIGLVAILHGSFQFDNRYRMGLAVYAPYFLAGIAVADLSAAGGRLSKLVPSYRYDALLLGGLGLLVGLGLWFERIDAHPQGVGANLLAPVLGLGSVVSIYMGALHGRVGRVCFGAPWIALIGTMCYSIYLTHIVVVQGVSEVILNRLPLHNAWVIWGVWMPALALAVFLVALVFYIVVERPLMGGGSWRPAVLWTRRDNADRAAQAQAKFVSAAGSSCGREVGLISPEQVDGLSCGALLYGGAAIAARGVKTVGGVEAFYVGEQVAPGLLLGGVNAVMQSFGFKSVEEAFHGRITGSTCLCGSWTG